MSCPPCCYCGVVSLPDAGHKDHFPSVKSLSICSPLRVTLDSGSAVPKLAFASHEECPLLTTPPLSPFSPPVTPPSSRRCHCLVSCGRASPLRTCRLAHTLSRAAVLGGGLMRSGRTERGVRINGGTHTRGICYKLISCSFHAGKPALRLGVGRGNSKRAGLERLFSPSKNTGLQISDSCAAARLKNQEEDQRAEQPCILTDSDSVCVSQGP
ncbi:hypothetical protein CRENBAI_010981 [Crenichthys baileyi]|uniref:Uncharacterized protein n=1 Tax=Crenichthys baileyi TaxID=28760 RepID=A0AAV9RU57_9TELE